MAAAKLAAAAARDAKKVAESLVSAAKVAERGAWDSQADFEAMEKKYRYHRGWV
jgi:hypothetical protein